VEFDGDSGLPNSCHLLVRDREGRTRDLAGHRLLCRDAPHPLPGHVRMQGLGSMSLRRLAQQGMRKHSQLPKGQITSAIYSCVRTVSDTQWRVL
jgi:hypothetical protein